MKHVTAMLADIIGTLVAPLRARIGRGSSAADIVEAFEQSPKGTLLVCADTLQIIGSNRALRSELGFSETELRAMTLEGLFDPASDVSSLIGRLRDPNPKIPLRARQRCRDGQILDVEIVGYRISSGGRSLLAYMTQDVTLRNRFEARLMEKQGHLDHLAHHDQLTGLPNRLYLAAHLPNALEVARKNRQLLAILFLDLDRFKHINDSRGHDTGDQLLSAVARRIRDATPKKTWSYAWEETNS